MKVTLGRNVSWILLLSLLWLVTGCGSVPKPTPPNIAQIPPLPPQAQQPPPPPLCLPTCLDGWKRLVESLLK